MLQRFWWRAWTTYVIDVHIHLRYNLDDRPELNSPPLQSAFPNRRQPFTNLRPAWHPADMRLEDHLRRRVGGTLQREVFLPYMPKTT